MSTSPGDAQPVFDLIARSAAELCEARVALWELREGQMHVAAHYGSHSALVEPLRRLFPRPADPSKWRAAPFWSGRLFTFGT